MKPVIKSSVLFLISILLTYFSISNFSPDERSFFGFCLFFGGVIGIMGSVVFGTVIVSLGGPIFIEWLLED